MVSETLRLELAPLGVNVVTVETGAVRSRGQLDLPELKLPSSSRYLSIEKTIAARARGEDGVGRMETRAHAAQVVSDVINGIRGRIWRGGTAQLVRWVLRFLPAFVQVSQPKKKTAERIGHRVPSIFSRRYRMCLPVDLGPRTGERGRVR